MDGQTNMGPGWYIATRLTVSPFYCLMIFEKASVSWSRDANEK